MKHDVKGAFVKIIAMPTLFAIILVVGSLLTVFFQHPEASVSASTSAPPQIRNRKFHLVQECSEYKEATGSFCTIVSSDFAAIPTGSKVFYLQPPVTSLGILDSNIVLDAGQRNRAVGRCTVDLASVAGLCTISDGVGKLAGLQARIDVSPGHAASVKFDWRGTYRFANDDDKL